MSENIYIDTVVEAARTEEPITVTQWANEFRILPDTSPEPGPYDVERTPWGRAIMNALSPQSPVEIVWFMKGSQIGGTEFGNNWVGYTIDRDPAPFLYIMPNDSLVKKNSKRRINPLIEDTPCLREKIRDKSRDPGNTVYYKEFPGGELLLVGALATSSLKSDAIRKVMADEVDDYEQDVNDEGDIIDLIMARTRTFGRRKKVFLVSSPKGRGDSIIEKGFNGTDQNYFFVPCLKCKKKQRLIMKQLKWTWGKPDTVRYHCEFCKAKWKNDDKEKFLALGEMKPTAKSINPREIGFHVSALYSPVGWYSWEEIAADWERIYNGRQDSDPDVLKLKTFINTVLGETFEQRGDAPEWQRIFDKRERYKVNKIPKGGLVLTAGVDIQKDRAEVELVAWGRDNISWSIDYRVIPGSPKEKDLWEKLGNIFTEIFETPQGLELRVSSMAVDSGSFGWTHDVYMFGRKMGNRVMIVKGFDSLPSPLGPPKAVDIDFGGRKIKGGVQLWGVGVKYLKSNLYYQLRLDQNEDKTFPPGYCHFPDYGAEFFKGLTSENLVRRRKRSGVYKYEFTKMPGRANEPLDCRVYARAAAVKLGIDRFTPEVWQRVEDSLAPGKGKPKKGKRVLSSGVQI